MLISVMFVAKQSVAGCNQTLFSKLIKLFSDAAFIVAIKRKFNTEVSSSFSSNLCCYKL